jgi:hypothetical protein
VARFLRKSTAITVVVGPFANPATGFPVTTLTDQSANARYVANGTGATLTVTSWTHDGQGEYLVGLSTTHTGAVNKLRLAFSDGSTYLPVWEDFVVLDGAVYDSLFGATSLTPLTAVVIATAVTDRFATIYTATATINANVVSFTVGAITSAAFTIGAVTKTAAGFIEALLFRAKFDSAKKAQTVSDHKITTFDTDGATPIGTQTWSDDGAGNETVGPVI